MYICMYMIDNFKFAEHCIGMNVYTFIQTDNIQKMFLFREHVQTMIIIVSLPRVMSSS